MRDFEGTANLFKTFITQKNTGLYGTNNLRVESVTQHGGVGHGVRGYQGCGCGGGGGRERGRFGGRGGGGGRGYQGRVRDGGGQGNIPCHINGIDISDHYYSTNQFEQMVNEGRAEMTCLRRARDKNQNQSPALEPASAQAAVINVYGENHIARYIVVATMNNHKLDQAAAAKPLALLPPVFGNVNNPSLHRPDRR